MFATLCTPWEGITPVYWLNIRNSTLRKLSLLILITMFVSSIATTNGVLAEILEVNHVGQLSSILKNTSPDALIIFDVDEVLVYPENVVQLQVAADFWEDTMENIEKRMGKEKRNAMHATMLLQSTWALTDPEIPMLIQALQSKKNTVLALTAFWVGKMGEIESVEHWRSDQLRHYGIDFSINAIVKNMHFEINNNHLATRNPENLPVYHEGIIFTNRHQKGEVISAFLKQINFTPKEIVFIDDRMSHIKDLENYCSSKNIPYVGIHDNRIFNKHHHFNEKLGKFQFEYLEKYQVWLKDGEAMGMTHCCR